MAGIMLCLITYLKYIMAVDLINIWDNILEYTKQEIGERAFENWFTQTRLDSITEDSLVIEVPSNFFKDWIYDHYRDTLNIAVLKTIGTVIPINFVVKPPSNVEAPPATKKNLTP